MTMEGEMIKNLGSWCVKYTTYQIPLLVPKEEIKIYPLSSEDVEWFKKYEIIFDNLEARVFSNPKVRFEVIEENNIKYAKLIH